MGIHHWAGIDGALEWIHLVIHNALQRNTFDYTNNSIINNVVKKDYLGWEEKLRIREENLQLSQKKIFKNNMKDKTNKKYKENIENYRFDDNIFIFNDGKDFLMYTSLFRTAMGVISLK